MLQRASKIRLAIYDMESALEQLDNFEMQIIECKYRYKMGSTKAAMALNVGSHNTITRIASKLFTGWPSGWISWK